MMRKSATRSVNMLMRGMAGGLLLFLAGAAAAQTIPDTPPLLPDQWIGSDDAPVTVVAYVSLNCPHCATFHAETMPALRTRYIDAGKLRVSFRDFPTNPTARQAALLARCSGDRRDRVMAQMFADLRQWAFETQPDRMIESAVKAGMDRGEIDRCLKDQRLADALQKGMEMSIPGPQGVVVPFFFVNGVKYQDALPADAIDKALATPPPYEQSKRWCLQEERSPGATLRGCAAVIAAAREPADVMARVHEQRGLAFIDKGDIDRAMEEFTAAIPLNPKGLAPLWRRGMLRAGKHDIAGAMEDFDRVLRADPNNASAWYGRGLTYEIQKDYPKTLNAFDQALRLDPKYVEVLVQRSMVQSILNQPARAMADAEQAVRVDPSNARALHRRAVLLMNADQTDKALADLAAAIQSDPRFVAAYALRMMIRSSQGKYAEAIQDLDRMVVLNPDRAEWLNERCWDKAMLGQIDGALADCDAAVRLQPSQANNLDSRGFVRLKARQWDAAITDYEAALKLEPDMATSLYGRGIARRAKGDTAGGDADLAAARKASPTVDEDMARAGITP